MPDLCDDVIFLVCDHLLDDKQQDVSHPKTPQDMLSWNVRVNLDNTKILHSLALVSRAWNRVCGELLYRSISLRQEGPTRLDSLLQTCATNPTKAQTIRRITIRSRRRDKIKSVCNSDLLKLTSLLNISPKLQAGLRDGLLQSCQDAKVTLLLCLCRNIQELQVEDADFIQHSVLLDVLADSGAMCTPPTPKPRGLSETRRDDKALANSIFAEKIPVFENLLLTRIAWKQRAQKESFNQNVCHAALLYHNRLFVFPLRHESLLLELLSRIPTPDELFLCASLVGYSYKHQGFLWSSVGCALECFVPSLRVLKVQQHGAAVQALTYPKSTLVPLSRLEILSIDFYALFGRRWQAMDLRRDLPTSLKVLHVTPLRFHGSENHPDQQLIRLARDPAFSRLREIRLGLDQFANKRMASFRDGLQGTSWQIENVGGEYAILLRDCNPPGAVEQDWVLI